MKIVHLDASLGEVKLEPETLEDLWTLSRLLEEGDEVEGKGWRRFKTPGLERGESGEKKAVHLRLRVVSVEFAESANKLRVTGVILHGEPQEYAPTGEHHTLDVELHGRLLVRKKLEPYHLALLREAQAKAKHVTALIVVMDDEKATFAQLQKRGIEFPFEVACHASKRDPATFEEGVKKYYSEVLQALDRAQAEKIVVAGPGFTTESFKKYAKDKNPKLAQKLSFEHASSAERSAVHELLKGGVLEKLLGEQKLAEEFSALEELKKHVAKEDGLAVYGLRDVQQAVAMSAASKIMVADALLRDKKTKGDANQLLDDARKSGADILIFNSEDDAGREFAAFQLAALLRFKLTY